MPRVTKRMLERLVHETLGFQFSVSVDTVVEEAPGVDEVVTVTISDGTEVPWCVVTDADAEELVYAAVRQKQKVHNKRQVVVDPGPAMVD